MKIPTTTPLLPTPCEPNWRWLDRDEVVGECDGYQYRSDPTEPIRKASPVDVGRAGLGRPMRSLDGNWSGYVRWTGPGYPIFRDTPVADVSKPQPKTTDTTMATKKTDWSLIELVLKHSARIMLFGPPGTGKTQMAVRKDKEDKRPVYVVTLTPEMPAAELRGHYVPVGGEFKWKDGPALSAWRNGGRLVINEIDHATGDVQSFLHNLLDDPNMATMTLPTGETISPADGFQVIATMNGVPDDLPEPLRSRFPVRIEVVNPNPEAIQALPEDLRNAAQGSCVNPDPNLRINLRSWYEFANLRSKIGVPNAAAAVFGKRAREVTDSLKLASAS